MDREKLRWSGIALMLSAIGALVWIGTGGGMGSGGLNAFGRLLMLIALIFAVGLFGGAVAARRRG